MGPGYRIMAKYIASEQKWLDDFSSAWKVATTNGHSGLRYLDQTKSDPEPVIDLCSSLTHGRSCREQGKGACMWKKHRVTIKKKNGTEKQRWRGQCEPYSR